MIYLTESSLLLHAPSSTTGFFSRLNKAHIFLPRYPRKPRFWSSKLRGKRGFPLASSCLMTEDQESSAGGGERWPPFDLNLAVVLAGFAFEAYTTPPIWGGVRQMQLNAKRRFFQNSSSGIMERPDRVSHASELVSNESRRSPLYLALLGEIKRAERRSSPHLAYNHEKDRGRGSGELLDTVEGCEQAKKRRSRTKNRLRREDDSSP